MSILPAEATIAKEICVSAFGGDTVLSRDLDGDGQQEFLILQSPGQFASELNRSRTDLDDVDRHVFCITAIDMSGRVLWQYGEPYQRSFPYTSHGSQGGNLMLAEDVDGDGIVEVIAIRRDELVVLDGTNGKLKRSVQLPSDNFCVLESAQMGPKRGRRQVLCKVTDIAYPPWEYGNPLIIYNADLSVFRPAFAVKGSGHNFVVKDINADGRDEVFVGYSLLDHDGRCVWTLDMGEDFDYVEHHADHIALSDINHDGREELRLAGSEDFLAYSVDGEILWRLAAGHSQQSAAGPWASDGSSRIILAEKNDGLTGVSGQGEILWRRDDLNGYVAENLCWPDRRGLLRNWGLFRPQLKPFLKDEYISDPAWSRELWPTLIDGDGRVHDFLPWRGGYAHPPLRIRAKRSYDCGLKYYPVRLPGNEGDADSVMVHDRRWIRVFQAESGVRTSNKVNTKKPAD